MSTTLSAAVARLQAIAGSVAGIKEAPTNPPEHSNQFPFAISYLFEGEFDYMMDWGRGLHTVVTEVHFNRQSLPQAVALANTFFETYIDLLMADPTLAGTVEVLTFSRYEFGQLEYNGTQTIGWLFKHQLKLLRG